MKSLFIISYSYIVYCKSIPTVRTIVQLSATKFAFNEYCNIFPLVNGTWRDDEEFSECSEKCGGGNRTKAKYCDNPSPSNGGMNCTCDPDNKNEIKCNGTVAIIQETCNENECAGKLFPLNTYLMFKP